MTSEDGLQQIGTGAAANAATLAPPLSPKPTPQPQGSPRRVQDDEHTEDVVLNLPSETASPRGAHADGQLQSMACSLSSSGLHAMLLLQMGSHSGTHLQSEATSCRLIVCSYLEFMPVVAFTSPSCLMQVPAA